jgi:transposase InsO family protein
LFKLKEPRDKIARWIEILSYYDFTIEYRPGKKQGHCDALSRCENPKDCTCPEQDTNEILKCGPCRKCIRRSHNMIASGVYAKILGKESTLVPNNDSKESNAVRAVNNDRDNLPSTSKAPDDTSERERIISQVVSFASIGGRSTKQLTQLQNEDTDIGPILQAKSNDTKITSEELLSMSPASRQYSLLWDTLEVRDGLLYKRFIKQNKTGEFWQFIVPHGLRKEVLFENHDSIIAGHFGVKKTCERIKQNFYWYGMKGDIELYVRHCDTCASDKKPPKTPRAPLGTIKVGAPMDIIATDYLGPFPQTSQGNRYILVLTDHFSKYVEILAVPDQTAETCASRILNDFIARWGCPLSILSDQGRNYESSVFRELCKILEIKKIRTSPKNPKCNGQAERFNRTLVRMIKAYLCGEQDQWDKNLGCLAAAYRSTPHESTGMTPNLLMMGREVRLPSELVFSRNPNSEETTSYVDYVAALKEKMHHAHQVAREHLSVATKRQKEIYDKRQCVHSYEPGDFIWLLEESRKPGITHKLEMSYEGPFVVKQSLSNVNFRIQLDRHGKEKVVNHNKLKPYEGTNAPKWLQTERRKLKMNKE